MIGLMVCLLTYGLRSVEFGPLRVLVTLEDRAYLALFPPSLRLEATGYPMRPVIFVDIDDQALAAWRPVKCDDSQQASSEPDCSSRNGTPRKMIAEITKMLKFAEASVILLDFDFRSSTLGDEFLRTELERKSSPTQILIPHFFRTGLAPTCQSEKSSSSYRPLLELNTAFDDVLVANSVVPVHVIISSGAYGLIDSICSAYPVTREQGTRPAEVLLPSAMSKAVELIQGQHPGSELLHLRWFIRKETQSLYAEAPTGHAEQSSGASADGCVPSPKPPIGKEGSARGSEVGPLAYLRIEAKFLVKNHEIKAQPDTVDLASIKCAIVVVGATHEAASDIYPTPVGDLPGALVHANLGLGLQLSKESDISWWFYALFELSLIAVVDFLMIRFVWFRLFLNSSHDSQLTVRQHVFCSLKELLLLFCVGVVAFVLCYLLAICHFDVQPTVRFAMLSFGLGGVVVFIIEVINIVAEATASMMEARAEREPQAWWIRRIWIGAPTQNEDPPP